MMTQTSQPKDQKTAEAFASSWNNLPPGSVYTEEQFTDWMAPLESKDAEGKRVLELGCGSGSLMVHMAKWEPAYLEGVDLGDSVLSAEQNLSSLAFKNWKVTKSDLVTFASSGFDLVYCIGYYFKFTDIFFGKMVLNRIFNQPTKNRKYYDSSNAE